MWVKSRNLITKIWMSSFVSALIYYKNKKQEIQIGSFRPKPAGHHLTRYLWLPELSKWYPFGIGPCGEVSNEREIISKEKTTCLYDRSIKCYPIVTVEIDDAFFEILICIIQDNSIDLLKV